MIKINVKALSVNSAWRGRRFRTEAYKAYQRELAYILPQLEVPDGKLKVYYEFGVSSKLFDWDNGIKQLQDCLCKKYNFDDRNIYEGKVKKVITKKGEEYIKFKIEEL